MVMKFVASLLLILIVTPQVLRAKQPMVDLSKRAREAGPEELVRRTRASVDALNTSVAPVKKVKPGDVDWHPSLAIAQAAAKRSQKPVLVFQLLGQLDEEMT